MDVDKILKMANEVEDLVFSKGFVEIDKVILYKFLYFNHLKLLGEMAHLKKGDLRELDREIEKEIKSMNYKMTLITEDRDD